MPKMKQTVVVIAGDQAMEAIAPILRQAHGSVFEHVTKPEWAANRLTEATPDLLILVHPLPGCETAKFWMNLERELGSAMPQTVVVTSPEDLFDLEPLQAAGVPFLNGMASSEEIAAALSAYLRMSPRPHARVMVKVAVEMGAGKVLRIAQTVNVSRSGLLIRTKERFPPGSKLDLKMELPGDTNLIEARAEVVRLADPEVENVRGIGARFVWFRGSDEDRFDEFMRRAVIDSASAHSV